MKSCEFFLLIIPLFIIACSSSIDATDIEMEDFFRTNKSSLTRLLNENDCISEGTKDAKCKALMKEMNIFSMHRDSASEAIFLDYNDFVTQNKGFVYSKEKLVPLYANLDSRPNNLESYKKGYKEIEENWYIYYEYLN